MLQVGVSRGTIRARVPVPYAIRARAQAWDAVPLPGFQIFLHKAKRKLSTHGPQFSASSLPLGLQLSASNHLAVPRLAPVSSRPAASSLPLGLHLSCLGQHLVPRPAPILLYLGQ